MVKKAFKETPVEEEMIDDPKKKRMVTPEQLEHLAKIREIAAKKKRELKEVAVKARNVEKEALELKAQQYDKIQEEKQKLQQKEVKPEEEAKPKKKVKQVVKEESNDDASSEEEEIVVRKKKSHKPPRISDVDDVNIHHIAYKASQDHLVRKIMSDRILNNLTNYSSLVGMKYY